MLGFLSPLALLVGRLTLRVLVAVVIAAGSGIARGEDNLASQGVPKIRVARLNYVISRTRYNCSAALYGKNSALAVQACILDVPIDGLHLLFGYDRGEWISHRRVKSLVADPSGNDVVLACLDGDVENASTDLSFANGSSGETVQIVGYWAPRDQLQNVETCQLTMVEKNHSLASGCSVGAGSGGAGVFVVRNGSPGLSGIVTGWNSQQIWVDRWTGESPDKLCAAR